MLFSICVFMLGISYILCEFDEVKYFWIKYLSILLVITTMFIMQLLYIEESLYQQYITLQGGQYPYEYYEY